MQFFNVFQAFSKVSTILLNFEKLQFTLDDYCTEVVPTLRQKLRQLRRVNLGKLFNKAEIGRNCMEIAWHRSFFEGFSPPKRQLDTYERSQLSISEIMKALLLNGLEVYEASDRLRFALEPRTP